MSDLDLPAGLEQGPLQPGDLAQIHEALWRAYDIETLDRRLGFSWGARIDQEVGAAGGSKKVFGRLLDWAEEAGRARDLLALAWTGKPGNPYLRAAAERLLPDLEAAKTPYDTGPSLAPLPQDRLEALVAKRSRIVDFTQFQARLTRLAGAICRIEDAGGPRGTGFLVGRRHVLTNHHVVSAAIADRSLGAGVVCRFDYRRNADRSATAGVEARLAEDWHVDSRPHSQSDVTGTGDPAAGELDFALLKLAESIPIERQSLDLAATSPVVVPGDVALVAQHPGGDPLSVAYGVVTEFPANGLRYRYNVTTEPGASGSPVLSADLDVIGLHHAADPARVPRFNQAVPLYLVARAVAQRLDLTAL
ncbi:trypsin-like peptidase domain-containing protein [Caulobacter sp. CCNWLY153]|uniref:trypsin-like peptidase domain-containing protein n=1 Tax=unclassified Caulobacter TaxID=2648921 RepID=UPI002FF4188B